MDCSARLHTVPIPGRGARKTEKEKHWTAQLHRGSERCSDFRWQHRHAVLVGEQGDRRLPTLYLDQTGIPENVPDIEAEEELQDRKRKAFVQTFAMTRLIWI